MTNEEKQLLLKDLCARLPYGVKCWVSYNKFPTKLVDVNVGDDFFIVTVKLEKTRINKPSTIEDIKPYLRPMSSMTEEEKHEYTKYCFEQPFLQKEKTPNIGSVPMCLDWLNSHHFDYRDLISKGLALESPEGMYKN